MLLGSGLEEGAVLGWTPEEAKDRLEQHLVRSSLHKMLEEDAKIYVEVMAEPRESVYEPQQQPRKKRAVDDGAGPQHDMGAAIAEAIRQLKAKEETASRSSEAQSRPSSALTPLHAPLVRPSQGGVTIRLEQAKSCHDAMSRAYKAARHVQRLCSAAANAFSDEAETIQEAVNSFDVLIRQASD